MRPRNAEPTNSRERLKLASSRATQLRQLHPRVAELRVEFEFRDGTSTSPSAQTFSYFPSARGFFRYACPCHACSGEFDLSSQVAELAADLEGPRRSRSMSVACAGERVTRAAVREACPVQARVRISAVANAPE